MHGLKTIVQLNELAAQNEGKFIEEQLQRAAVKHEGEPLAQRLSEDARELQERTRETAIADLEKESFEQLISRVEALTWASTLEVALCRKLKKYLGRWESSEDGHVTDN